MPRILFVASSDPAVDLGQTVLFRSDVERLIVSEPGVALGAALNRLPNLIVVKDERPEATLALLRKVKEQRETRRVRFVVLTPAGIATDEAALAAAGASLVLRLPVDPLQWDDRLEEMMAEPRRRDARIPARFVVWPRSVEGPTEAVALNLSVRGVLLETQTQLAVGTTLELTLDLPGFASPLQVVGQVVRNAGQRDGPPLYGVDFIILRGDSRERIESFVEAEARL